MEQCATYFECSSCGPKVPCRLQIFGGVSAENVELCPLSAGGETPIWDIVKRGPALMKVFEELVAELEGGK